MIVYKGQVARCKCCGNEFEVRWNKRTTFCSSDCYHFNDRVVSSKEKVDRLMALYASTDSFYMRDLYLTMADEEVGVLKVLTGWDRV